MVTGPSNTRKEDDRIYSSVLRVVREAAYRRDTRIDGRVFSAIAMQLADPSLTVADVAAGTGLPVADILDANVAVARNEALREYIGSLRYPYRLRTHFAARTIDEFLREPDRLSLLLAGQPVLASTVELHPSTGTCNYSCAMCLWSDKKELSYAQRNLTADGLLSVRSWLDLLADLWTNGARHVVFSGGGEVLLNRSIVEIIEHALALGFSTSMYTTGYLLDRLGAEFWSVLCRMQQIRLSVHSPREDTYNRITGQPGPAKALRKVTRNARTLLEFRHRAPESQLQVGLGFVLQPANFAEILEMAHFSADLGVDFLDIRKDEVDVTEALGPEATTQVRRQLLILREEAERGDLGHTRIDLSDELVMLADDVTAHRTRSRECLAKYFRPTISPYGLVAPCDLKAEPRFADSAFNLGLVPAESVERTLVRFGDTPIADACTACMPSSRTGNLVWSKLLSDARSGIDLARLLPHTLVNQQPTSHSYAREVH